MSTLVILAAGMGSRFGGIKQLEALGPSGEIIIDYSIYDAIKAGFNKVVFIIRKDIEKDFKEVIGDRISKYVDVEYVFQSLDDLPDGYKTPEDRVKPWGTGQALRACRGVVNEPFVVINADDYYGKEGFIKIHDYLENVQKDNKKYDYCMAGFLLGNTLSDHGTVTRGVCSANEEGNLVSVRETYDISRDGDKAIGYSKDKDVTYTMDLNSPVSMNMWGFTPDLIQELDEKFPEFLDTIKPGDIKAEYLLPEIVSGMLNSEKATVKVLDTSDKWFGVTYKEDKEVVQQFFKKLADDGVYPKQLWD
ncbi:MAG: nucleotidyltransferase [Lachnospiraceae bacterium]|nr:nucleotidyltransferase [Lachnospiraceae bacterium]